MTFEIAVIFVLLIGALISFAAEKIPADLTALTLFAILLLSGLLSAERALNVFSNPAPITVGAMFIISAAMERCGLIDTMATRMEKVTNLGYAWFLFFLILIVASISAFINNTPVVVVFMPIVLSMARRLDVPASKLLIPLSYASIFGGTCTLIGTSTNLLVSGIAQSRGHAPLGMFEITWVGLPLLGVGTLYIILFGYRLLPVRETLTSILSDEERREYITEAFVQPGSPVIGQTLKECGILGHRGIRVIEVVRNGVAIAEELTSIVLEAGDRMVLACRPSGIAKARGIEGFDFVSEIGSGLEQIAAHEGAIVEGIIGPNSTLIGRSISEVNFRQTYRMIILALHRRGRNVRDKLQSLRLEFGDTLLMLGTDRAIQSLRGSDDVLLIDRPPLPVKDMRRKIPLVLGTIGFVVASATFGFFPIEVAAIAGCAFLFLTGCLKTKEGYHSVQWNILFLIFGMLAMGLAMEETGASAFLAIAAVGFVETYIPEPYKALVMLACVYLMTTVLTEILSNNAAAVLIGVLSFGIADTMGVDPRPFIIAVAIAASASFATPIGYQTNTYVYGVGGYRFTDFVKIGLPLNVSYFVASMVIIPRVWSF